jgi:hypothetical protein
MKKNDFARVSIYGNSARAHTPHFTLDGALGDPVKPKSLAKWERHKQRKRK